MLLQCDAKLCTKCKKTKPLTDFNKGQDNGYRYQCKECNLKYQANSTTRKAVANRYYQRRKEKDPSVFMWKQAKHRAKWDYGDMEFTITVEDILLPEVCPYMGVPFSALDKKYGYSLDRVDSSKGYTKDNIQVISRIANIMKNNATEQELISFAKGVLSVHSQEGKCCVTTM